VREGFSVDEILIEDGRVTGIRGHGRDGKSVTETAKIVIGADGRHSRVAKAVSATRYNEKPVLLNAYFAYWSNLPADHFEVYIRPVRGFAMFPTNDNLTLLVGGWPHAEFHANRQDVEGNFLKMLEYAPDVAERVRNATRETPWSGAGVENFFRKPYGPGWALVGDAGYNKDAITACGISDAFRDAELLTNAVHEWLTEARPFDEAMSAYQHTRDEHVLPMYEYTTQLASMEPPPAEMLQLIGAMAGNQDAMDQFVSMNATTMSPVEFFAPDNVGRIMAGAGALVSR
jgi:2-polyprenyl-6-methoxyphenol hydroxylase-like FAD-dependent oxidoreductase